MRRLVIALAVPVLLLDVGCSRMRSRQMNPMEMEKPARPSELNKLDAWVGTWTGTAEVTEPLIEGEEAPVFEGGETWAWTLNKMYLRGEGWHEMPDGDRMNYVSYVTWDDSEGKYRSWMFDDWGTYGNGWISADATGDNFTMTYVGYAANGDRSKGRGSIKMIGNDKMTWEWEEDMMKLTGTSSKVK